MLEAPALAYQVDDAAQSMVRCRGMPGRSPSATDLADLLVAVITGVEAGTDEHWRSIIGQVHQLPILFNVRSNWQVKPKGGTRREREIIAHAAEVIRQAHPYVNG